MSPAARSALDDAIVATIRDVDAGVARWPAGSWPDRVNRIRVEHDGHADRVFAVVATIRGVAILLGDPIPLPSYAGAGGRMLRDVSDGVRRLTARGVLKVAGDAPYDRRANVYQLAEPAITVDELPPLEVRR